MHFYLDTVSRNHNKEEQVEGVDRFQAVSRRTAKIAITELSTLLAISCSLQPDLTMNLLPLEICHITGTTTGFRFYQTKVWFIELTNNIKQALIWSLKNMIFCRNISGHCRDTKEFQGAYKLREGKCREGKIYTDRLLYLFCFILKDKSRKKVHMPNMQQKM